MNEADTRANLIDPKLMACGWGVVEGSKILREYHITAGKIQTGGVRAKPSIADYVLSYKGIKLAVIEAKSDELEAAEGVARGIMYGLKQVDLNSFINIIKLYLEYKQITDYSKMMNDVDNFWDKHISLHQHSTI